MRELICSTPDAVDSLMIVGHNPAITHLANLFLDPGIEMLPTTGIVCISFESDTWKSLSSAMAIQEFVVSPKMIE
jgi:phosphohistidine phosphatase